MQPVIDAFKKLGSFVWGIISAPWHAFEGLIRADQPESPSRFVTVAAASSLCYAVISLTHAVAKCAITSHLADSPKTELGIVVGALGTLVGYVYTQSHITQRKAMDTQTTGSPDTASADK